jgi:hypothetical protein
MWKEFYLSMEKSSVSKLAASSFTSQFFSPPSGDGDSEKCLTAIKNSIFLSSQTDRKYCIPSRRPQD